MTLIEVVEQVKMVVPLPLVIPAVGAEVFCVMVMDEVLVHPLAVVTVTVYVAGLEKLLFAVLVLEPPLQAYVPPPVAETLIAETLQFNSVEPVLFVIATVGGVVF